MKKITGLKTLTYRQYWDYTNQYVRETKDDNLPCKILVFYDDGTEELKNFGEL